MPESISVYLPYEVVQDALQALTEPDFAAKGIRIPVVAMTKAGEAIDVIIGLPRFFAAVEGELQSLKERKQDA